MRQKFRRQHFIVEQLLVATVLCGDTECGNFLCTMERERAQLIWWVNTSGVLKLMHLLSMLSEYKLWTCWACAKLSGKSSVHGSLAMYCLLTASFLLWVGTLISPCAPTPPCFLRVPLVMSCQLHMAAFPNTCLRCEALTFPKVSVGLLSWTDTFSVTKPALSFSMHPLDLASFNG